MGNACRKQQTKNDPSDLVNPTTAQSQSGLNMLGSAAEVSQQHKDEVLARLHDSETYSNIKNQLKKFVDALPLRNLLRELHASIHHIDSSIEAEYVKGYKERGANWFNQHWLEQFLEYKTYASPEQFQQIIAHCNQALQEAAYEMMQVTPKAKAEHAETETAQVSPQQKAHSMSTKAYAITYIIEGIQGILNNLLGETNSPVPWLRKFSIEFGVTSPTPSTASTEDTHAYIVSPTPLSP